MRFYCLLLIALLMANTGQAQVPEGKSVAVREDVARYIEEHYPQPLIKSAATQLAATLQMAMEVDTTDKEAVRRISHLSGRAIHCLYYRQQEKPSHIEPSAIVHKLEALTVNTATLRRQYAAYNRALSGSVSSLPDGNTCDDETVTKQKPD